MSLAPHRARPQAAEAAYFTDLLHQASAARESLAYLVTGPDGLPEMAWVAYERSIMIGAVNEARDNRGLPSAGVEDIRAAEIFAVRSPNFAAAYGHYCAILANGSLPPR